MKAKTNNDKVAVKRMYLRFNLATLQDEWTDVPPPRVSRRDVIIGCVVVAIIVGLFLAYDAWWSGVMIGL